MSCITSFWKMTFPGVVATFWPRLKARASVWVMRNMPLPALKVAFEPFEALHQIVGHCW